MNVYSCKKGKLIFIKVNFVVIRQFKIIGRTTDVKLELIAEHEKEREMLFPDRLKFHSNL